jgi:hypothetical protein
MADDLSWLMQAGMLVHERGKANIPLNDVSITATKVNSRNSILDNIRARKQNESQCTDELVEMAQKQAVCTRCGSNELDKIVLLNGGCSHLLCIDCLDGIKSRKLLDENGLALSVCPVCKTNISQDATGKSPVSLVDFLKGRGTGSVDMAGDSIDYRSVISAEIHLVSRVYWARMRVLLCKQSELLAASYTNLQESEVALQKSMGDLQDIEQICLKAKLHLAEATQDYESALKSFQCLEASVSGDSDMTLDEAKPLNLVRFQSANSKFLAFKNMQSAGKQHAKLEHDLLEAQGAHRRCGHVHNTCAAAFEHCTKSMDRSYSSAFRQFEMIKRQLRETRSLLPDAAFASISEGDMDEQFRVHTSIIRDLDDAKWHFQQNLVYPLDIPINIELTLTALEEEFRIDMQGPAFSSDIAVAESDEGKVKTMIEAQSASRDATLKVDGRMLQQQWEIFPTRIVPDDCPTIQEAVKSLWRSCGRVVVKPGVYKEYVLLEGLVKICCEDLSSTVSINPVSESQNTMIEVIGGFCIISNVTIQCNSSKSDAPLIFCRSGSVQLVKCVLKSLSSVIAHAIGAKSACHFEDCNLFGGKDCSVMVCLDFCSIFAPVNLSTYLTLQSGSTVSGK